MAYGYDPQAFKTDYSGLQNAGTQFGAALAQLPEIAQIKNNQRDNLKDYNEHIKPQLDAIPDSVYQEAGVPKAQFISLLKPQDNVMTGKTETNVEYMTRIAQSMDVLNKKQQALNTQTESQQAAKDLMAGKTVTTPESPAVLGGTPPIPPVSSDPGVANLNGQIQSYLNPPDSQMGPKTQAESQIPVQPLPMQQTTTPYTAMEQYQQNIALPNDVLASPQVVLANQALNERRSAIAARATADKADQDKMEQRIWDLIKTKNGESAGLGYIAGISVAQTEIEKKQNIRDSYQKILDLATTNAAHDPEAPNTPVDLKAKDKIVSQINDLADKLGVPRTDAVDPIVMAEYVHRADKSIGTATDLKTMIENEQKDHNARMTDKATTERIKASATATRASRAGAPKPVDRGKAMADLDAQIRTKLSGTYGQGKVVVPGAYGTQTETPVPAEQTKKILESSPYTPESEYAKFAWTMNPDQARKAGIPKPASVQTDSSMTPASTGTPTVQDVLAGVEKRAAAGDTVAIKGLPVFKKLIQDATAGDTAAINQLQSRGIAWP